MMQRTSQNVEANKIIDGLWQGGAPPPGREVRRFGFDVLVLTAQEYQPPATYFEGVKVIHAGYDDAGLPMTSREWQTAVGAAKQTASAVRRGKNVLVTCWMGLNRSGLVSALTLYMLFDNVSGARCAEIVQAKRKGALVNRYFVERLHALPASKRAGRRPLVQGGRV